MSDPSQLPISGQPRQTELNGAQIAEVNKAVREIASSMGLRQWCVERALQISSSDPMKLAREIYRFVTGDTPTVVRSEER